MTLPEQVVRWIRGDVTDADFEKWLYGSKSAEEALGATTYFDLIELDYRDRHATRAMRHRFIESLCKTCLCPLMLDRQWLSLSHETLDFVNRLDVLRERTPWLRLNQCHACGQYWYTGIDTVDDGVFLERLKETDAKSILNGDAWPTTFDGFAYVWPQGQVLENEPPQGFSNREAWGLIMGVRR